MPAPPDETSRLQTRIAALERDVADLQRETAAKEVQIRQLRANPGLVPASPKTEPSQNRIVVNGIEIVWDAQKGICTFSDLPAAMLWVDTTLAGLMAGMEAMVGPERFALALQAEGRKSVESDWMLISRHADFREGFAAIANTAAIAGWGDWQLITRDPEKRQCQFRVHNNWEGLYQKALGVCWGSGLLAGKLAGICAKLFGTNCWATQTMFVAKGDACDEFIVAPSRRNLENEIDALLDSDQATRADMAVTLHRLRQTEASMRRQIAEHQRTVAELNATRSATLNLMEDAVADRNQAELLNRALSESESALRQASNYNRSLIEAALDPLVTIGADGRITDVNHATELATGRTRAELIGTDFSDYFTDPEKAKAGYEQAFREGAVHNYPLELRCRAGRVMAVLYNAAVYRDETGKVIGVFAAARDITERKQAEAEVRALNATLEQRVEERTAELIIANQELESFSYSVSHDLRAPLRTLDGFSRILLEDYADKLDAEAQNHLHRIRAGSQRMGELIDGLLKLSRITRGELHHAPVNLSRLAQAVAAELWQADPARKVEFCIAPDLMAEGDANLLQIALENLLGNAWKFTARQPAAKIEFGRQPQAESPVWFVRDNGVGLDMTYTQKLFGVFQRFHAATEFPGTGIGLATTQRIIHRHGGRIWAESQPDCGATFYFTLPN